MGRKTILRISAVISGLSGLMIIFGVLLPIVQYEIMSRQKYPVLITPVKTTLGGIMGWKYKDSTKISNWFDNTENVFGTSQISTYSLSILKLGIEDAKVVIGAEDLTQSLIHYSGTALPGKIGNSVIFGHSVLPIFYNSKDYGAIFSTLPVLEKGDIIEINFDGVLFRYRVESMFEVYPEDIQILEQESSDSFLTLVTCVPPGDPRMPRRLIVRARVIPFN